MKVYFVIFTLFIHTDKHVVIFNLQGQGHGHMGLDL